MFDDRQCILPSDNGVAELLDDSLCTLVSYDGLVFQVEPRLVEIRMATAII